MKQRIERVPFGTAVPLGESSYTFQVEIDPEKCSGCGKCAIECPSQIIEMRKETHLNQSAPCYEACLSANDVRGAMSIVKEEGDYEKAWRYLTRRNPFPASVGRACPHPCEDECSRGHLDEAVNLHSFERFIGDHAIEKGWKFEKPKAGAEKKAAVVGGGSAGLSCAYQLARRGVAVTVFERDEKAGGMMQYGIPQYRIPKEILDQEIERILEIGVTVETGKKLGENLSLNQLKSEYDVVFLATGNYRSMKLNVPGEECTVAALSFLHDMPSAIQGEVIVVGGGNVAIDSARTAMRLGADKVTVVSLEQMYQMSASNEEIRESKEEGIVFVSGQGSHHIETSGGRKKLVLKRCVSVFDENGRFSPSYDEEDLSELEADLIITAIGQLPERLALEADGGVKTVPSGHVMIADDCSYETNVAGVYAGGDAVRHHGNGSVAGAIDSGVRAAEAMLGYLGMDIERIGIGHPELAEIDLNKYREQFKRCEKCADSANSRKSGFREYVATMSGDEAGEEISRCLTCGTATAHYIGPQNSRKFNVACNNCHNCVDVCEEKAIEFRYVTATKQRTIGFSD